LTDFEGVVPALAEALAKREYSTLTPVQQDVLAPELRDADLLVSAQTGSGKTVAFGMSIAPTLLEGEEKLPYSRKPLALVVAPTRELALQVRRELEWLYAIAGASLASCVGGMDMRAERSALNRGAHIVVGTPGRLRDHIERGSLDMSELRAVVLDEADEMLDLGFREDLEFILDAAPDDRRTLMFSATVPRMIVSLAKRYQRDAIRVATAAEERQHVDIEYRALTVAPRDRENAIINVLRYYEATSAIVFCATREGVNRMTSRFTNRGFSVVALSGELSQSQRTHALQSMRDGRAKICIATDVAARGLDLPDLELVIHADLPQNSQVLLHRSGRTGRAGRKGVSVVIVPFSQRRKTERLLQGGRIEANWASPPSAQEIIARDDERILADTVLTEPMAESDGNLVEELLKRHSAEQIAAAFVRKYRAGQSAPEDIQDSGPANNRENNREKRKARVDFEGGVWFSLTVGRRQNAETRWLLPMLYKAGNIAQGDLGAIKIYDSETHVEIAPSSVERFVQAIGANGTVEKSIRAKRMEGMPSPPKIETFKSDDRQRRDDSRGPDPRKKPYKPRNSDNDTSQDAGKGGEWRKPQEAPVARHEDMPKVRKPRKPRADAASPDGQKEGKAPSFRDDNPAPRKPRKPKAEGRDSNAASASSDFKPGPSDFAEEKPAKRKPKKPRAEGDSAEHPSDAPSTKVDHDKPPKKKSGTKHSKRIGAPRKGKPSKTGGKAGKPAGAGKGKTDAGGNATRKRKPAGSAE
jgi:ATP-dependent RNA helicase DeaD